MEQSVVIGFVDIFQTYFDWNVIDKTESFLTE